MACVFTFSASSSFKIRFPHVSSPIVVSNVTFPPSREMVTALFNAFPPPVISEFVALYLNIKQIEKYQSEIESLESKKKEAEIALKNFTPPKLGELPEGKYEIFLVFGDGKPRPFIVTEINNSNQ